MIYDMDGSSGMALSLGFSKSQLHLSKIFLVFGHTVRGLCSPLTKHAALVCRTGRMRILSGH